MRVYPWARWMLRMRGFERSKQSRHSLTLHTLRSALAFPTCMMEVRITLFLSPTSPLLKTWRYRRRVSIFDLRIDDVVYSHEARHETTGSTTAAHMQGIVSCMPISTTEGYLSINDRI